jgi:hypothetical protein
MDAVNLATKISFLGETWLVAVWQAGKLMWHISIEAKISLHSFTGLQRPCDQGATDETTPIDSAAAASSDHYFPDDSNQSRM